MEDPYTYWLEKIANDFAELEHLPADLKRNVHFLAEAVKRNNLVFKRLPDAARANPIIAEAAIRSRPLTMRYVPKDATDYKKLWMIAFEISPYSIESVPDDLRTKEIYESAVRRDGLTIESIPEDCKDYKELCGIAMENNPYALKDIKESAREDAIDHYIASKVLAKVFACTTLMQEAYAVNSKTINSKSNPDKKVALKNVFRRPEIIEELFTDFITPKGIEAVSKERFFRVVKNLTLKKLEKYYESFMGTDTVRKAEVISAIDNFCNGKKDYLKIAIKHLETEAERKRQKAALKEAKGEEKKLITNLVTKKTAESSGVFKR